MAGDDREYLHTLEGGAWLPLAQSLISGILAGAVVLAVGIAWHWPRPWVAAFVVGTVAMLWFWIRSASHWTRLTRSGDNPDPVLIPQPQPAEVVRVELAEVSSNGHLRGMELIDLPASHSQLSELASGILNDDQSLAERVWVGPRRPFTPKEFRELRAEMVRRGLLITLEGDPRQGFILTVAGRHVLAGFLSPSPTGTDPNGFVRLPGRSR